MSNAILSLIILGGYVIVTISIMLIWIFIDPSEDLFDIFAAWVAWPFALLLLIVFLPSKLLDMLQNKVLERRAKKKYYDEDEYRSENEDWYSED